MGGRGVVVVQGLGLRAYFLTAPEPTPWFSALRAAYMKTTHPCTPTFAKFSGQAVKREF